MFLEIILLVAALGLILIAAEFFTNGIEHLGDRLQLGEAAVGSVLAAVGTAMPETLIPVAAIVLSKSEASNAIGQGAILGAPFMLSTLALAVTGLAAFAYARRRERGSSILINRWALTRDLTYFLPLYGLAVLTAWLPTGPIRWAVCFVLLGGYVRYVIANMKQSGELVEERKPLRLQLMWVHMSLTRLPEETREAFLHRRRVQACNNPHTVATVIQIVLALGLMLFGARMFVHHVEQIATLLGVSGLVIALILAPVATELPEKFNSVIWMREGKEVLSLGNITGAMVFQSTIPTTLGIALTDWRLHNPAEHGHAAIFSVFIALAAAVFVLVYVRQQKADEQGRALMRPWGLLAGLPLYLLFILAIKFQW